MTGLHRKAAIRLLRRAPRAPGDAGPWRPAARLRPGGGRRRRGALAGQRPDRRPPAPALRAGPSGPPAPVRRTHPRPGGRQARAPSEPPHPRAPAGPRPGPLPAAGRDPHARRPRPPARDPDPHLRRVDGRPSRAFSKSISSPTVAPAPRASISAPSAPWTSPPRGSSWRPSGARAKSASAAPSTASGTRLPMPLLGLDSDNGSEFINRALLRLLPPPSHHLHPQPPLEEERQCPCRAEERRRRPPARRL